MININATSVFCFMLILYFGAAIAYFCFKKELLAMNKHRITALMGKIPLTLSLLSMVFWIIWGLKTALFIALTTALHCLTIFLVIKWLRYMKRLEKKIDDYDWSKLADRICEKMAIHRK